MNNNNPIVRGGQGRSAQDITDDAFAFTVIGLLLIVLGIVLGVLVFGGEP